MGVAPRVRLASQPFLFLTIILFPSKCQMGKMAGRLMFVCRVWFLGSARPHGRASVRSFTRSGVRVRSSGGQGSPDCGRSTYRPDRGAVLVPVLGLLDGRAGGAGGA